MLRGRLASRLAGARSASAGILALLGLALLFELPALILPEPVRLTGEVLVLLTVSVASLPLAAPGTALRWMCGLAATVLAAYRLDQVGLVAWLGEEPLLYDQVALLPHLGAVLWDLWSWGMVVTFVGLLVGAVVLTSAVGALHSVVTRSFGPTRVGALVAGVGVFWLLAVLIGYVEPNPAAPRIRWLRPAITASLQASWRLRDALGRDLRPSPYAAYSEQHLTRKPDVYLFVVPTYGRFVIEEPASAGPIDEQLRRIDTHLRHAGWHTASTYSRAPVMGGRSWLAEASVLMGTAVEYESVRQRLVGNIEHVPHLVSFLAKHGYATTLLAPSNRIRPGVEDTNDYGYDQQFGFEDMDYAGPAYGLDLVPDQYSLERTHEEVLRSLRRPRFIHFRMASARAPWTDIPPLADDWRRLRVHGAVPSPGDEHDEGGARVEDSVFGADDAAHATPRLRLLRDGLAPLIARHRRAIAYELDVIDRHLAKVSGDAIAIVMGDHPPPLLAMGLGSHEVPVHVLARDPRLLEEFLTQGFTPGLRMHMAGTELRHEALFSLVVRALARVSGVHDEAFPKYFPRGITYIE